MFISLQYKKQNIEIIIYSW